MNDELSAVLIFIMLTLFPVTLGYLLGKKGYNSSTKKIEHLAYLDFVAHIMTGGAVILLTYSFITAGIKIQHEQPLTVIDKFVNSIRFYIYIFGGVGFGLGLFRRQTVFTKLKNGA